MRCTFLKGTALFFNEVNELQQLEKGILEIPVQRQAERKAFSTALGISENDSKQSADNFVFLKCLYFINTSSQAENCPCLTLRYAKCVHYNLLILLLGCSCVAE